MTLFLYNLFVIIIIIHSLINEHVKMFPFMLLIKIIIYWLQNIDVKTSSKNNEVYTEMLRTNIKLTLILEPAVSVNPALISVHLYVSDSLSGPELAVGSTSTVITVCEHRERRVES